MKEGRIKGREKSKKEGKRKKGTNCRPLFYIMHKVNSKYIKKLNVKHNYRILKTYRKHLYDFRVENCLNETQNH